MASTREKKQNTEPVGEPVWILAWSLIYLNLPAFLGVETQESWHERIPLPFWWPRQMSRQRKISEWDRLFFPAESALSGPDISFDLGSNHWESWMHLYREVGWGGILEGALGWGGGSDAPSFNGDCLSLLMGPQAGNPWCSHFPLVLTF